MSENKEIQKCMCSLRTKSDIITPTKRLQRYAIGLETKVTSLLVKQ